MGIGIAGATVLDLVRRPAFSVSVGALGVVLALLPRLGNPAAGVADNARLAVELSLSTMGLAGPLAAACLGVWSVQRDHDAGLTMELVSSRAGVAGVVFGRWAGVLVACACLLVGGLAIGSFGWIGAPGRAPPLDWVRVLGVACWFAGGLALGGAIGAFWGGLVGRELACVVAVIHVVVARFAAPAAGDDPLLSRLSHMVPDPARMDVAHDVAFGRSITPASALFGLGSSATLAVALLLLATFACRRRVASGAT
ncbi:MAG: hypothetical protein K8T90_16225 [Planctomycetes bacterium]|nr:hypothetical protein [Planctomycetota bacterium]